MQLFITRPFEKININIEWIEIETVVGNFIIQPEHAPMVIELKPGIKAVYELPGLKIGHDLALLHAG